MNEDEYIALLKAGPAIVKVASDDMLKLIERARAAEMQVDAYRKQAKYAASRQEREKVVQRAFKEREDQLHQNIFGDQKAFMDACQQGPSMENVVLYHRLVEEETGEFRAASADFFVAGHEGRVEDQKRHAVEMVDACFDTIYVLAGLLHAMGVEPNRVWKEGHRSNMAKVTHPDGNGGFVVGVRRREDGKVLKPEGWTKPDFAPLIEAALAKLLGGQPTMIGLDVAYEPSKTTVALVSRDGSVQEVQA